MITKHYLIYTYAGEMERRRLGVSDLAVFRMSREHTGGRLFKVFQKFYIFRPKRCKKNIEEGIVNNVYVCCEGELILQDMAAMSITYEDLNPWRMVEVRMQSADMSISTHEIMTRFDE